MPTTGTSPRRRDDARATMTLLGMTLAEEEFPFSAGTRTGRTRGIVVRGVAEGSMAQRVGIREGDIVAEVDNLPVGMIRELERILAGHPTLEPLYALFLRHDRWQLKILCLNQLRDKENPKP